MSYHVMCLCKRLFWSFFSFFRFWQDVDVQRVLLVLQLVSETNEWICFVSATLRVSHITSRCLDVWSCGRWEFRSLPIVNIEWKLRLQLCKTMRPTDQRQIFAEWQTSREHKRTLPAPTHCNYATRTLRPSLFHRFTSMAFLTEFSTWDAVNSKLKRSESLYWINFNLDPLLQRVCWQKKHTSSIVFGHHTMSSPQFFFLFICCSLGGIRRE